MSVARSLFESGLAVESMTALWPAKSLAAWSLPRAVKRTTRALRIPRVALANHQVTRLQSIHRSGDGAAGEADAPPDLVHRRGPL